MPQNGAVKAISGEGAASARRAASPSRQILTLFGEYWWNVPEQIPSAAIVAALGDAGVTSAAARATLSRLTRAGILVNGRVGRRTVYGLSPRGVGIVEAQIIWLDTFGIESQPWDGTWSVIAFSVPEHRRSTRHQVRSRLRWLGYTSLHDGLWISATDSMLTAMDELRDLGAAQITALRTSALTTHPGRPQAAWELSEVVALYRELLEQMSRPLPDSGAAALRERMEIGLAWQRFRVEDPGLPEELLPDNWPRCSVRAQFVARHEALAPAAEARVRQHVAAVDEDLATLVTQRRFRD